MHILVFEDALAARLHPITTARPAFSISCGACRLIDHLGRLEASVAAVVRPHLREFVAMDEPGIADLAAWRRDVADDETVLLLNARLVPSMRLAERIAAVVAEGGAGGPRVARAASGVAAAVLPGRELPHGDGLTFAGLAEFLAACGSAAWDEAFALFEWPHDVVRHHLDTMAENLSAMISRGGYHEVAEGVFRADREPLGPHVAANTDDGPIVLERDVRIGPFVYLQGPLHAGAGCRIAEHASLKHCVALGHTTKIGGEVSASIVEPYSNKQHAGYLGHSYLGSWVNVGALTCTSDLKNTYGSVNAEYRGQKVPSGMQFLGAIVGDYAKTAIQSTIFSGKSIGVASFVYGTVSTAVPSFVNYARQFGEVTAVPVEVALTMQRRMFRRRAREQRPCDIDLMRSMFELTRDERLELPADAQPPRF